MAYRGRVLRTQHSSWEEMFRRDGGGCRNDSKRDPAQACKAIPRYQFAGGLWRGVPCAFVQSVHFSIPDYLPAHSDPYVLVLFAVALFDPVVLSPLPSSPYCSRWSTSISRWRCVPRLRLLPLLLPSPSM
jgi:hypothetical protein